MNRLGKRSLRTCCVVGALTLMSGWVLACWDIQPDDNPEPSCSKTGQPPSTAWTIVVPIKYQKSGEDATVRWYFADKFGLESCNDVESWTQMAGEVTAEDGCTSYSEAQNDAVVSPSGWYCWKAVLQADDGDPTDAFSADVFCPAE